MIRNNCLSLNERDKEELLCGQHIEERRETVSRYSQALKIIPVKIDSYLYEQNEYPNCKTIKEEKELVDFMRRDTTSKEKIIKECKSDIKAYITQTRLNRLFIVKLLKKIKKELEL